MAIPYLSVDQKVQYLYDKGYFPSGSISEDQLEQIAAINFHYFLGYARNFRMLADQGRIKSDKNPQDLLDIISEDHRIANALFPALRTMEWNLRRSVVEHYCEKFESTGSFLQTKQYRVLDENFTPDDLIHTVLGQVLRYGENYVAQHIDEKAARLGTSRLSRADRFSMHEAITLVKELPLWSVIDSFSLGTLSRFIMSCDPTPTSDSLVWKSVAEDFEIPASIFATSLRSVTTLRNLVAHHSRLWMRPTTDSPRPPKKFKKLHIRTDPKAMYVAFLTLGLFQGKQREHMEFANKITELSQANEHYWHGVTKVRQKNQQP